MGDRTVEIHSRDHWVNDVEFPIEGPYHLGGAGER